jgi:hypothetical protein
MKEKLFPKKNSITDRTWGHGKQLCWEFMEDMCNCGVINIYVNLLKIVQQNGNHIEHAPY